jgi:sugar lactone lactonase YvrE
LTRNKDYSWADHTSDIAPQLGTATYRFDPRSGNIAIVDDTLSEPNGIAFSPDARHLYLSDTGAGVAVIGPEVQPVPGLRYNSTGKRTVYAFDVSEDGRSIGNKRPIYLSLDYAPDGLKVARNGMLVTATGHGVDVLDEQGKPLVRVQTNFTAVNMEFVGPNYDELWIVGIGGVARVKWALQGPVYT